MAITLQSSDYFYSVIPVSIDLTEDEQNKVLADFPVPQLSASESTLQLDSIEHGSFANQVLLLLSQYSVEKASNGNPYLKMTFQNSSGSIPAKMWDNNGAVEKVQPLLDEYSLFVVSGKVEEFPRDSGKKSITISTIQPYETDDVNPFSLLPTTQQCMKSFTLELFSYLNELEEPHREIGLAGMKRFWNEFVIRPAAKGYHHNYLGGLLKHTVGLMRIARFILDGEEHFIKKVMRLIQIVEKEYKKEIWSNAQSEIPMDARKLVWTGTVDHLYDILNKMIMLKGEQPNKSILITSIFYHDIGKLMEYTHAGKGTSEFQFLYPTADTSSLDQRKPTGITMDPLGVLVGHMPYGVLMLSKILETNSIQATIEDIHLYNHCILSHHGKHEWQSTVVPATTEAFLLHLVDFLDSRYEGTEEIK